MIDDIVTRLRADCGCTEVTWCSDACIAADEIETLRKLTGSLATLMMPFALLMTKEEQETVMKAVRGE